MSESVNGSAAVCVGAVEGLPEGSQTEVRVDGVSVVVVCDAGGYYALRNVCSHQDFPLLGGDVSMGRITCAKHGAKFELATGKAKTLPAVKPVRVYRTRVEDGQVWVEAL
ncbi:Rieske 2Fe-2S domain-containing protein [Deinococcus aquiradiocola]|uniref:Ferredoxin n=1 Tax=Deinococcus aquiradiocola TaxID=393059 RepID=A0A917PDQ8_9DEIO|nr:Rieske 2Fe-2S domain-containing protein [Deinococcus aquiradiocola]GGJ72230.1 ferredoxin [Deinococcus aquiradiocola]